MRAQDGKTISREQEMFAGPPTARHRIAAFFHRVPPTADDSREREAAEAALRASEVKYRRLFQSAKDGILILDAGTLKILDANHFMTDLLGYSHDEFLGKELWQIGFFEDKPASKDMYRQLQETGYVRYDHLPLQTRAGNTAQVEFISNVYQVGEQTVAQCNVRDISERIRIERKLQEHAQALADTDRHKSEFLAMLAHELRGPLAPIANAAHMLGLQKDESPLQLRLRTLIQRQLGQLTRLVDDLMEISRISTGQIQILRDQVDLNDIAVRAAEAVVPLMVEHRHDFRMMLPAQPVWLYADAARLEQVIVNLLTNAAKYTDDAGLIHLSVEQDSDTCVLRLRDTGIGIAPELLPRVFDLFTQADGKSARSRGGLGIGLALVRRLVELHDGRIEVKSVLGQGSEFEVRLPLALAPSRSILAPSATTAASATPALRVLVVDDNLDTAESMAELVTTLGHDVRTAYDGISSLQAVIDYRPDLIMLDIGMPGLNGHEVAVRIRQLALTRDLVLVATTGYGQESDRGRSLEAGFDHHLVKPVDFDRVRQILAGMAAKRLPIGQSSASGAA
jgi:PAS domain S-box-containing protein